MKHLILGDSIRIAEDTELTEIEHTSIENPEGPQEYYKVPNIYKFVFELIKAQGYSDYMDIALDICCELAKVYLNNRVESSFITVTITPIPNGTPAGI